MYEVKKLKIKTERVISGTDRIGLKEIVV